MCLGIPARVVEVDAAASSARVDVSGVARTVNTMLLADAPLERGDWVLLHVGFAMAKIDEDDARTTLEYLRAAGAAYAAELELLRATGDLPHDGAS